MFFKKGWSREPDGKRAAALLPPLPPHRQSSVRSAAPSIISGNLLVTGVLSSPGTIQVDGRVEGVVQCTTLVVGDTALVHGDVIAQHVTVRGRIEGNICGTMVLLTATCHVEGDILHRTFAVEPGAFFDGNCRHSDNPLDGGSLSKSVIELGRTAAAIVS